MKEIVRPFSHGHLLLIASTYLNTYLSVYAFAYVLHIRDVIITFSPHNLSEQFERDEGRFQFC